MGPKPQRPKDREEAISALDVAIEDLNHAQKVSSIAPTKGAFGTVNVLLTDIRSSMANELDYVELGLRCADVCRALDRATDGKKMDELNQSVYETISLLTVTATDIQRKLIKWGKRRNGASRLLHAMRDKETIDTWRSDLDKILQAFNKELQKNATATVSNSRHDDPSTLTTNPRARTDTVDTHPGVSDSRRNALKNPQGMLSGGRAPTHASAPGESLPSPQRSAHSTDLAIRRDLVKTHTIVSELHHGIENTQSMVTEIRHNLLKAQGRTDGQDPRMAQGSISGESPPPPGACFGREELIEKIIRLGENLTPVALIGAGGIGKTAIALAVLHDSRIKGRFGDNRRFIRCDQLLPSSVHLLNRLSNVIGAGVENAEDLTPLRPFLSSKEMLVVLDNAESILDPQGKDAQKIYAVVEELSRFKTVWLCITSRITTVPRHCKRPVIPTLSIEAACNIFYGIYDEGERSDIVSNLLRRLEFHALSITLLATVAFQNMWDYDRLAKEWDAHRTQVLRTDYNESLAATIELSLASPTFLGLGPKARDLLSVVAFFPKGVNENDLDWLLQIMSDGTKVFDKFCALSLTNRNNAFVTMLAPLRDYLSPEDPKSSPLFSAVKEYYFTRMAVIIDPNEPSFKESQWIVSEDENVEHLLDIFTTIDADSDAVWIACANFARHLIWHKNRSIILKSKIEGLPDNHPSKPECFFELSRLSHLVGNFVGRKRLLIHTLELYRRRGDTYWVAQTLRHLSHANRRLGLLEEGISQAKEALEIFERLGYTKGRGGFLINLALLLRSDGQLDSAKETLSRAIDLCAGGDNQFLICQSYRVLGGVYRLEGEVEKAIHHFEVALEIGSSFNWHDALFFTHMDLMVLFRNEGKFDDAYSHIERAKFYAAGNLLDLGCATEHQARILFMQGRLEEARSEALCAADLYGKVGAVEGSEECRRLSQQIEESRLARSPLAIRL